MARTREGRECLETSLPFPVFPCCCLWVPWRECGRGLLWIGDYRIGGDRIGDDRAREEKVSIRHKRVLHRPIGTHFSLLSLKE